MKRADFVKIVGEGKGAEYAPVAGLLQCGYGFAGYFNSRLDEGMDETCVLVNVRLAHLSGQEPDVARPRITDFNEFVEEIVRQHYEAQSEPDAEPATEQTDVYGSSMPLAAIPFDQIAVVYPVAQISKMLTKVQEGQQEKRVPSFLDLNNKSEILRVLRAKLW